MPRQFSSLCSVFNLELLSAYAPPHPNRPEDQTGIARMDEIANYKVVYSLWAAADKARAAGAKLTAMIGARDTHTPIGSHCSTCSTCSFVYCYRAFDIPTARNHAAWFMLTCSLYRCDDALQVGLS